MVYQGLLKIQTENTRISKRNILIKELITFLQNNMRQRTSAYKKCSVIAMSKVSFRLDIDRTITSVQRLSSNCELFFSLTISFCKDRYYFIFGRGVWLKF